MKKFSTIAIILCLIMQMLCFSVSASGDTIYVSPTGSDINGDGTFENPYLTMEKAKSVVKNMSKDNGDINVIFMPGQYQLKTISFTADDSGSENGKVIYKSYDKNNKAVFTSAADVSASLFTKVSDYEVLKKIPYNARNKVLELNLYTVGINASASEDYYPQLYINNESQFIARYPNSGYLTADNADGTESFLCGDERSARWENVQNAWIDSDALSVYAWNTLDVLSVSNGIITVNETVRAPSRTGAAEYYIANLIEELDVAGEYYVDMDKNVLYYYPNDDFSTSKISIDGYDSEKVISLTDTKYVSFEDLSFERTGKRVIYGENLDDVDIIGCNFINIQSGEGVNCYAIDVEGYDLDIDSNYAYMCKDNFIRFNGGKLNGFIYGNINVTNNRIFACGIESGHRIIDSDENSTAKARNIGNNVSNNVISDSTGFAAISVPGNNVTVHNNEIYNIGRDYNDAGAIYFGKSNLKYGNTVMYNYVHDLNEENEYGAFYSDDGYGGLTVKYNIVNRAYTPFWTGMGMNNDFSDNLFVNCVYGMRLGTRMTSTWEENNLWADLKSEVSGLDNYVYKDTLKDEYPDIKKMLTRTPFFAPWNTVVIGNVAVGTDENPNSAVYATLSHQYNKNTGGIVVEGEDTVAGVNDAKFTASNGTIHIDELKLYGPSNIKTINGKTEGNPGFSYLDSYFANAQNQDYTPTAALISAAGANSDITKINMANLGLTDTTKNTNFSIAPNTIKVYEPVVSDSGKTSILWEKVKDASYYIINVSENKDMSSAVSKKIFEQGSFCVADFELDSEKTYYMTVSATSLGKETSGTITSDVIEFNTADFSDDNLAYALSFAKSRIDSVEENILSYTDETAYNTVKDTYTTGMQMLSSAAKDEKNAYSDTVYDVLTSTDEYLDFCAAITKAELSGSDDVVLVEGIGMLGGSLMSVMVTTPDNTKETASEDRSAESIRYMNFVSSDSEGNFSFDFPTAKLSEIEYEGEFTVYATDSSGTQVSKTYTFASVQTGEVKYYDKTGLEILKENLDSFNGETITVKLPVINRTKTAYTPAFIVTSNSGGLIKNVNYSDTQELSANSNDVLSCDITYNSEYTYEFMLWESFGVMKPLTKKAVIE